LNSGKKKRQGKRLLGGAEIKRDARKEVKYRVVRLQKEPAKHGRSEQRGERGSTMKEKVGSRPSANTTGSKSEEGRDQKERDASLNHDGGTARR